MSALSRAPGDEARLRLDLAYGGLPASAARMFRLLSVHPGPDMSIAAVAALADLPVSDAKPALERLVQAQLIEMASRDHERWQIRSPAREYAQRLAGTFAATDGRDRARDRLIEYYLLTAEAADELLRGLPPIAPPEQFKGRNGALAWLDSEWLCLVATVRMAADAGREQATASLPLLMAQYLDFRGRFDELIAITTTGLAAARRLDDRAAEGECLTNLGLALFRVRRLDEAVRAHQHAAAIFRETGDRQDEGAACNNLGLALHGLGRDSDAIRAHQEAAAIFSETGYHHEEAEALANLGNALNGTGLPEEASAAFQKAADIFRETGDQRGELMVRQTLHSTREMS